MNIWRTCRAVDDRRRRPAGVSDSNAKQPMPLLRATRLHSLRASPGRSPPKREGGCEAISSVTWTPDCVGAEPVIWLRFARTRWRLAMTVIWASVRILAALIASECCFEPPSELKRGRRECRVAGRNPWPPEGTTGSAKSSGVPCAMVLAVSFALSLGPGLLPPSPRGSHSRNLTPASGCRDHTPSRPHRRRSSTREAIRARHQSVHRIPRSTCRDDRPKRPSFERGGRTRWTISDMRSLCPTRGEANGGCYFIGSVVDHSTVAAPFS